MITSTIRVIHQIIRGYITPPKVNALTKTVNVEFRCWPIDIDSFLHMNNSKYLQAAELSRWRTIGSTMPSFFTKGVLFLVVENNVKYLRPIQPFQRYVVSTSVTVDQKDDKWIYYKHVFEEHPDDVGKRLRGVSSPSSTRMNSGDDDDSKLQKKIFAVVEMKSVVKESNGKTVRPSDLMGQSSYLQQWVAVINNNNNGNDEVKIID